jgi:hypothetical protein
MPWLKITTNQLIEFLFPYSAMLPLNHAGRGRGGFTGDLEIYLTFYTCYKGVKQQKVRPGTVVCSKEKKLCCQLCNWVTGPSSLYSSFRLKSTNS